MARSITAILASWLVSHSVALKTLRIRIERLENERQDLQRAADAATAAVAEDCDRTTRSRTLDCSLNNCDCDFHGSAGGVQGNRAAGTRADHGDTDNRVSVTFGYGVYAHDFLVNDWEVCKDVMNCDHVAHHLLGRKA